jgi:hypothetical protein
MRPGQSLTSFKTAKTARISPILPPFASLLPESPPLYHYRYELGRYFTENDTKIVPQRPLLYRLSLAFLRL